MAGSDDLMLGLHELDEAREVYDEAWDYWTTKSPEHFDSPVWRRIMSRSPSGYRINISKIPIISLADRLKVSSFVALDLDGAKDPDADVVLREAVVKPNKLKLQTPRLVRNTLVYGDSYWSIWPQADPLTGAAVPGTVRINYNSPCTTRAIYDADDELTMIYVIRRYMKAGHIRASITYGDRVEMDWVLKDGAKPDDPHAWDRASDAKDVEHDYGRPPIFHFRTGLPYGCPEAEDSWGPQDAINKLTATAGYTSERAGLQDRYVLTDPNAALNGNSINSPEWDDDGDAGEGNRDSSLIRTGPGEMQVLEGIKSVGEWSAAQPDGFMALADWFAKGAAMVSRVSTRYADPGGQHPTGAALRAADSTEASKAEDKRDYFDEEMREALSFALTVAGMPDRQVDVRWKPSGIVDDVDTWQIVDAKVQAGVPRKVAILETGMYEPEEVDSWLEERQDLTLTDRISLFAQTTGAISQLGQSMALGLLDEAMARAVIQVTLGELIPDGTDLLAITPAPPVQGAPDAMPDQPAGDMPDPSMMDGQA